MISLLKPKETKQEHRIYFDPKEGEWGRGIYHIPSQSVCTWPEPEMTHYGRANSLKWDSDDCVGLYIDPGAVGGHKVTLTGSFCGDYLLKDKEILETMKATLIGLKYDASDLSYDLTDDC